MRTINLSKLLQNYHTGWVAISSDYKKVIAFGKTLKEVSKKVGPNPNVILIPASKNYRGFVTGTA